MARKAKVKLCVGRKEKIDLPILGLKDLDAKIDTGAFTCSIHCHRIKIHQIGRKKYLYFNLLDPSHPQYEKKLFKVSNYSIKKIKNSFGESEKRYVIKLPVLIYGKLIQTEFSLSDRSEMKFPVLIGRKLLLACQFMVDVTKYNLGYKENLEARKLISARRRKVRKKKAKK